MRPNAARPLSNDDGRAALISNGSVRRIFWWMNKRDVCQNEQNEKDGLIDCRKNEFEIFL